MPESMFEKIFIGVIVIAITSIGGVILINNIIYGIIFYILFGIIGVVIILLKKKYREYKKKRKNKKVMKILPKYPQSEERDW